MFIQLKLSLVVNKDIYIIQHKYIGLRLIIWLEEYDILGNNGRDLARVARFVAHLAVVESARHVDALPLAQIRVDSISERGFEHRYPVPLSVRYGFSL